MLSCVEGGAERLHRAWLAREAHALPLIDGAAALTAAPIDLLPHQVVLTHRIATAAPRRFLVADEVGLGKTIETALLLRELASRGELRRALMVVPAGLVNNWHREINDIFHLGFEVFGSEGDVTDRKSNAFAKHDRLIASIDTLKRRSPRQAPARSSSLGPGGLRRGAPPDGEPFREQGAADRKLQAGRVAARPHARPDPALRHPAPGRPLPLLDAGPTAESDTVRRRRRKCAPIVTASTRWCTAARRRMHARRTERRSFARRWVHTESFTMSGEERAFYCSATGVSAGGLRARETPQGNQGRALGFVMTIFQKIAASSFAAVQPDAAAPPYDADTA